MSLAKKVLIVEDEKPMAHALELKLTHQGIRADVANNGQEALELLAKSHYDVVLLDIMMPVMDGFQVLEKVQLMQRRPEVIVLSNLSSSEDKQKVLSMGARNYLVKSDTPLIDIVEEVKRILL